MGALMYLAISHLARNYSLHFEGFCDGSRIVGQPNLMGDCVGGIDERNCGRYVWISYGNAD